MIERYYRSNGINWQEWRLVIPGVTRWECQRCGRCCRDDGCPFLAGNDCNKYEKRGITCRAYPFRSWPFPLETIAIVHNKCPGVGKGPVIDLKGWAQILRIPVPLKEPDEDEAC